MPHLTVPVLAAACGSRLPAASKSAPESGLGCSFWGRISADRPAPAPSGSVSVGAGCWLCKKAVRKLTQPLIEDGLFHTIVLKCKRQKRRRKIAAATYLYQADSDGEWGEIPFDFENKAAEIIRLADWDKMISQPFVKYAISCLLNCQNEKLPKKTVISFEA